VYVHNFFYHRLVL